jgi:hypothetical protein
MHVPLVVAFVAVVIVAVFNFLMWKHYMDINK